LTGRQEDLAGTVMVGNYVKGPNNSGIGPAWAAQFRPGICMTNGKSIVAAISLKNQAGYNIDDCLAPQILSPALLIELGVPSQGVAITTISLNAAASAKLPTVVLLPCFLQPRRNFLRASHAHLNRVSGYNKAVSKPLSSYFSRS
jgi:hypothetical protein